MTGACIRQCQLGLCANEVSLKVATFGDTVQFSQCIIPCLKLDILCSQKNKKWALTPCRVTQTSLEEIQIKMEEQVL